MPEPVPSLLRVRVVKTFNSGNAEVTNNLPHLHQAHWDVVGFQPGNPGSSTLGSWSIRLHPPGSDGYAAAKVVYDQLDYFQRVEAYISHDGASLGKLYATGIITGIQKVYGDQSEFLISGKSDLVLANLSRPFPGELLSNDVTSAMLKSYLGTNELGFTDAFNPFTSGNYNSTNTLAASSGTWTGTTDDGFNVVSCATGTGAALIAKTGALANDRWHTQYVEVTGRLTPSADASNGGRVGIGMSASNSDLTVANGSILGSVTVLKQSGRYFLTASVTVAGSTALNLPSSLANVDDPQGIVPLTIGLLVTDSGNSSGTTNVSLIVNGKVLISQVAISYHPSTNTTYPFLFYGTPSTGTATCYLTNLVQMTRFTTDGASTAATFGNGTITAATHSLGYGVDPGPNFLEAWSRLATREGWYWRYTPQPYVVGTRTLGTVDFGPDPGTNRTTSVVYGRGGDPGNLVTLGFTGNADPLATDTAASGQSTLDGGGIGIWRDVASLSKYGVIQDEILAFTHSDFNSLRRAAYQVIQNKTNVNGAGSKTMVVLRDPKTVDVARELDRVTVHDPEMGVNMLSVRLLAKSFDEGGPRQVFVVDQFSDNSLTGMA